MGLLPAAVGVARPAPVDCAQVVEHRRLVALHRGDHVVGPAVLDQDARGLVLRVQRVECDHPAPQVEVAREFAHRRDLVGLVAHLDLPEHPPGAVLDRGDHHPALAVGALRGAAHILPVHGHRRRRIAALTRPRPQRPVQCVGLQRRPDVVEGGRRRRRVALPARTEGSGASPTARPSADAPPPRAPGAPPPRAAHHQRSPPPAPVHGAASTTTTFEWPAPIEPAKPCPSSGRLLNSPGPERSRVDGARQAMAV